ncbi:hypothetical protein M378DRAFT_123663 [Amanita muscaria Koide BX008]|uniref:Uncharacterized protein n=1 Tax=Amanita muscaria (strain Koide BX008) TaxID=946122 RepID=A0A0C2WYL2_AMAMK|nr:hypothetical protein M378DRAFT_123663 [Amanita muscaria Koide BX008]
MTKHSNPKVGIPGLDIPYNSTPDDCFGSALSGHTSPLTTLCEFKMMALMNAITDKRDWHRKVFEDEISEKWKKEAIESDHGVTEAMATWCIDELRYNAKRFDESTGIVTAYDADVVKSDTAVPHDLKEALKNAVRPLEDVPASAKDWHPGSDEKVLDLVHPSLFPLVYGLSRILPDSITNLDNCLDQCGKGMTLHLEHGGKNNDGTWDGSFNKKFQWLPCEVDISGDIPKITTYINNLHPQKHKELYAIIEKIIGCTIPLWNATLTPQKVPGIRTRISFDNITMPNQPEQGPDEASDNYWQRYEDWLDTAEAEQPEVGSFKPMKYPTSVLQHDGTLKYEYRVNLEADYGDRGLQIIVKLANIQLTPEKPEYEGGTWHIEGELNEHICATAIYYYDSENIKGSSLEFRQTVSPEDADEIPYEQNYHKWLTDIFGCENEEAAIQYIGSVDTREGRLITFPNILQHRVQPFKLADSTRSGHRKILALFLIDPNIKVISTANIPSQRLDWWRESLEANQTALGRLPLELKDHVFEQVEDFPVSMERAKELRLELMEARKNFNLEFEGTMLTFSLCEH